MDNDRRLELLEKAVAKLHKFAFGNGGQGLDERTRRVEQYLREERDDVKEMKKQMSQLLDERTAQQAFRRGVSWALGVAVVILGLFETWSQLSAAARDREVLRALEALLQGGPF